MDHEMNFEDRADGEMVSLGFGYMDGERSMAVYKGNNLLMIVPRKVMITALKQGWKEGDVMFTCPTQFLIDCSNT